MIGKPFLDGGELHQHLPAGPKSLDRPEKSDHRQ